MNVVRAICHLADIFMIFSGLHRFKRVSETSATKIKRIGAIWSHGPVASFQNSPTQHVNPCELLLKLEVFRKALKLGSDLVPK